MQKKDKLKGSVETFVEEVNQVWSPRGREALPERFTDAFNVRPAWVVDCLQYLKLCDWTFEEERTEILYHLISEGLAFIRGSVDRNDKEGHRLLEKVQETVLQVVGDLPYEFRLALNHVIYESKLSIETLPDVEAARDLEEAKTVDIKPNLPALLEKLSKEMNFKSVFELYELMLPQFQAMPAEVQFAVIAELANTKKALSHEMAVLMLLHPQEKVRQEVAQILYRFCDVDVFTSQDLRRMIMIRNWVPSKEREDLDLLIAHLRKNKLSPEPLSPPSMTRLAGSVMDGAGAAAIMMECKENNQRQIAGFVVKVGVGIRTPWVSLRASKSQADEVLNIGDNHTGMTKPISVAYVNKIVQHFLSESLKSGEVPEPAFLQVAEMFGAKDWQPQPLSWSDEMSWLRDEYGESSEASIDESLERSDDWHDEELFANSWFESGDVVDKAFKAAQKKGGDMGAVAECLMARCLDKWKQIFLINCLWMRSKKAHKLSQDLFVILHCLDKNKPPSEIPLICNLASYSVGSKLRRDLEM